MIFLHQFWPMYHFLVSVHVVLNSVCFYRVKLEINSVSGIQMFHSLSQLSTVSALRELHSGLLCLQGVSCSNTLRFTSRGMLLKVWIFITFLFFGVLSHAEVSIKFVRYMVAVSMSSSDINNAMGFMLLYGSHFGTCVVNILQLLHCIISGSVLSLQTWLIREF